MQRSRQMAGWAVGPRERVGRTSGGGGGEEGTGHT